MKFNWRKALAVGAVCIMPSLSFVGVSEAAEADAAAVQQAKVQQAAAESDWQLFSKAVKKMYGMAEQGMAVKMNLNGSLAGKEGTAAAKSGMRASIDMAADFVTDEKKNSHGNTEFTVKFKDGIISQEYSDKTELYCVDDKKSVVTYYGDSSGWSKVKTDKPKTDEDEFDADKMLAELEKSVDLAVVNDADGVIEYKLQRKAGFKEDDAELLKEKLVEINCDDAEMTAIFEKMAATVVMPTYENVAATVKIDRATETLTSLDLNMDEWLKDELLLINKNFSDETGDLIENLADYDTNFKISLNITEPAEKVLITVPKDIQKTAKKAKK